MSYFKPHKAKPLLMSIRSSQGKQESDVFIYKYKRKNREEQGLFCNQDQSSLVLVSSAIVYCNTPCGFFLSFHLMSSGLLALKHIHAHKYIKHKWSQLLSKAMVFREININVFFWDCYCKCCQNSSLVCMFGICVLLAVNCLLLFHGTLSRDTL